MNDQSIMPFGKFKGDKLEDVPAYYLLWLRDESIAKGDLLTYINENREVLEKQARVDRQNERRK